MVLSEEVISRRLRAVDQSSESIQTTSMWILHHRDSVSQFVTCWMDVFRTADDTLQIALFYVANDVCQKAKKKANAHVLLQAFAPHWVNAIAYSRSSENVQKAVSRILDIFEERQIYSKSHLADMRAAQSDSNELEDNSLLDFDIGFLIRDVEGYHKGNLVMERARELLSRSDFNFRDKIKSRMKDRRDGEKFMGEIEQSYTKLTDFFGALAKHRKRGQHLLGEIEKAKRSFALQLRDVTVVEDAYQKFGSGIDEVCVEVEEMLKSGVYPGASPPRDAPSPTANDDPFSEGVETAYNQMRRSQRNTALPLANLETLKEETTVTAESLQTNQSFKGSTHVLKIMEGIRGSEASKANSSPGIASDPRLASHPPPPPTSIPTIPLTAVEPVSASSFPQRQVSVPGTLPSLPVASVPSKQQTSQITSPQLVNPVPIPGVTPLPSIRMSPPNGSHPPWMFGPPPNFATPPPSSGTIGSHASSSGTTNSLETPVVSSQLHGKQVANTAAVAPLLGNQPLLQSTSPQQAGPAGPGLLPPPPPRRPPSLGVPLPNNFVPAALPPYTGITTNSGPTPAPLSRVPFPPGSFNVPPPGLMTFPPPTSLNIPPPGVMDCPSTVTFSVNANASSPDGPISSHSFSVPSPSSSSSTMATATTTTTENLTKPSPSNRSESGRDNGDLRHESRKRPTDFDDRRSFGGFHGSSSSSDRGDMRDPRGRDRDRSSRGFQQQCDSGGRRYSSDSHNRASRYRDYGNSGRSRRFEPPHNDRR